MAPDIFPVPLFLRMLRDIEQDLPGFGRELDALAKL